MRLGMAPLGALLAFCALVAGPRAAAAQPGQAPPPQQQPPGAGWGAQPGWGAPPQQPPTNYHLLSPEERELLIEGEISGLQHIGGSAAAFFFGFGVGQAVQGRYDDTGWIFTVGEVGSLGMLIYGLAHGTTCDYDHECDEALGWAVVGSLAFVGFHAWEIVDALVGPSLHNREVRRVRAKAYGGHAPQWGFHILPTSTDGDLSGATAGVSLRF